MVKSVRKGDVIGRGRSSTIIFWTKGEIVKLFHHETSKEALAAKVQTEKYIQEKFPFAPSVYGLTEYEGKQGIRYEYVKGPSMLQKIVSRPWSLAKEAHKFAEIHARMHQCTVEHLKSKKRIISDHVSSLNMISPAQKSHFLQYIRTLPRGNKLCHGDFHPGNVIYASKGPIVVDWEGVAKGHPSADVARSRYLLRESTPPESSSFARIFLRILGALFCSIYVRRYMSITGVQPEEIGEWQLAVLLNRLSANIPEEQQKILQTLEHILAEEVN